MRELLTTSDDNFSLLPVEIGQLGALTVRIGLEVILGDVHGSEKDTRGRDVTIAAGLSAVGVD